MLACACSDESSAPVDASVAVDGSKTVGCPSCIVFTGGNVFDGEVRLGVRTVVVEGATITDVVEGPVTVSAGKVVDLSGKTLLPGMIDLHTHLAGSGASKGFLPTKPVQGTNLKQLFRAGVTSFLDLGGNVHVGFAWRDRLRNQNFFGPRMFAAGAYLEPSFGGHCRAGLVALDRCILLDDPNDVKPRIDALVQLGPPDVLKMTIESGFSGEPFVPMKPAVASAIAAYASGAGLPLIAHLGPPTDFQAALTAKVPTFTHMPIHEVFPPALVNDIVASKVPIVPTLAPLDSLSRFAEGTMTELVAPDAAKNLSGDLLAALNDPKARVPYSDPTTKANLAADRARYLGNFKTLVAAGATFMLGSDSGFELTPFGLATQRELALMVELGMTPTAALRAATSAPAAWLRHPELGRIAKGATADILIVRGDPTAAIAAIRDVDAVYLGGQDVDVASMALDLTTSLLRKPVTGLAEGKACLGASECAAGLTCNARQFCAKTCTTSTDCAKGASCQPVGSLKACITGDGCSALTQSCGNGASCVPAGNGSTECVDAGPGGDGASCTAHTDCKQGFACAVGGVCRKLCDPAAPVCPGSQTCIDVTSLVGVPLGRCQ